MVSDTGALGVDVAAARTSTAELLSGLSAREDAVSASAPSRAASAFGQGLAERAERLVAARKKAHGIRLAHLSRLRQGAEQAGELVQAVSGTDQHSRQVLDVDGVRR